MASKLDRLQKKGFKVNEVRSRAATRSRAVNTARSISMILKKTRIMPFTVSWIPRKILRCWPMISAARGCCTTWLCSLRPVLAENMCCFPASAACVRCAC